MPTNAKILRLVPLVSILLAALPAAAQAPAASPPADPTATAPATTAEPTATATAPAQGTEGETPANFMISNRRTLNGHTFVPAYAARWAFTVTSLASDMILALGATDATFEIADRTFDLSADYAGIGGVLGYEYAFLDHFSVRAVLSQIIYSGINGESALAVGTEAQFGFGVGATAAMNLGRTLRAGLLFDVDSSPRLGLTIAQGLEDIANSCELGDCEVDAGSIFNSDNIIRIRPAVALNWAPIRQLGITTNAEYRHFSSSTSSEAEGDAVVLGIATDWDFGTHTPVPIALMVQFSWSAPLEGDELQHVTDLGGGIYYTGRKDLSAGVQFVNRRFAVTPGVDVSWSTILSLVGLRYYW